MKSNRELGPVRRWRALVHRHGSNLLGGVLMVLAS
jgi:hypothetical protein